MTTDQNFTPVFSPEEQDIHDRVTGKIGAPLTDIPNEGYTPLQQMLANTEGGLEFGETLLTQVGGLLGFASGLRQKADGAPLSADDQDAFANKIAAFITGIFTATPLSEEDKTAIHEMVAEGLNAAGDPLSLKIAERVRKNRDDISR